MSRKLYNLQSKVYLQRFPSQNRAYNIFKHSLALNFPIVRHKIYSLALKPLVFSQYIRSLIVIISYKLDNMVFEYYNFFCQYTFQLSVYKHCVSLNKHHTAFLLYPILRFSVIGIQMAGSIFNFV